ncbi:16111_t:CDS:10 [Entrophospora sp. SA101]|nr:16111_t:CDS:10 [Entrophospora sp. SA101]
MPDVMITSPEECLIPNSAVESSPTSTSFSELESPEIEYYQYSNIHDSPLFPEIDLLLTTVKAGVFTTSPFSKTIWTAGATETITWKDDEQVFRPGSMDFSPSYHSREDSDNDYLPASDSDSDTRSPKRLRIDTLEREINMRVGQTGNGIGGESTTNGRSSTNTNGNVQSSTNGQFSTNNGLQGTRRREIVRLMVQAMQDMGYNQAATTLENESGFPLESKDVARFKDGVLNGDWALVESLLPILELDNKQKFFELLESSQLKKALHVLRTELTPLDFNLDRVHVLSSYIMYSNAEDLRFHSEWDGAKGTSRQKLLLELQRYISPSIMVPEHRLETLLEQSITLQPSASRDKTAIIWSLETLDVVHILREHTDCVSFLSWSPDDSNLLTCGQDNKLKLWNVESGECLKTMHNHVDPVTTCAWLPDGKSFISGSQDKNTYLWWS